MTHQNITETTALESSVTMSENKAQTNDIGATYSAEDNKLRLYPAHRLDAEIYQLVRAAGFKWAPKQRLFVAPKWTPEREDLCIELAGEITAEQTTLVERAQDKAARLDALAEKRATQSNSFYDAACRISQRFEFGQPILVGHHSERKARKDQQRMHEAMDKAVKAHKAVSYWHYRAEGVEHFANMKGSARTRARRIKTLLAALRNWQRDINHSKLCIKLWQKIDAIDDPEKRTEAVKYYAGARLATGATAPHLRGESLWSMLEAETITPDTVVQKCLAFHAYQAESAYTLRWIAHILNRLAFERAELGDVGRYAGELTKVILQAFAREQGAHKPEATQDGKDWTLASGVDLPAHISESDSLTLDAEGWRDLMQASGYEVPAPKPRRKSTASSVPLINPTIEEAEKLQALWNVKAQERGGATTLGCVKGAEVRPVTQAYFSAHSKGSYSSFNTIELDINGHKIWSTYQGKTADPVCRVRVGPGGGSVYSPEALVVIEDKPQKALPIDWAQA